MTSVKTNVNIILKIYPARRRASVENQPQFVRGPRSQTKRAWADYLRCNQHRNDYVPRALRSGNPDAKGGPGRSAAWLAHLTGGQGVGGSNPPAPTTFFRMLTAG